MRSDERGEAVNPEILEIKQTTRLGANSVPVAVLLVRWKAGPYGPFDEESSFADVNSGKLMENLRAKTRALDLLPKATQTA